MIQIWCSSLLKGLTLTFSDRRWLLQPGLEPSLEGRSTNPKSGTGALWKAADSLLQSCSRRDCQGQQTLLQGFFRGQRPSKWGKEKPPLLSWKALLMGGDWRAQGTTAIGNGSKCVFSLLAALLCDYIHLLTLINNKFRNRGIIFFMSLCKVPQ